MWSHVTGNLSSRAVSKTSASHQSSKILRRAGISGDKTKASQPASQPARSAVGLRCLVSFTSLSLT